MATLSRGMDLSDNCSIGSMIERVSSLDNDITAIGELCSIIEMAAERIDRTCYMKTEEMAKKVISLAAQCDDSTARRSLSSLAVGFAACLNSLAETKHDTAITLFPHGAQPTL